MQSLAHATLALVTLAAPAALVSTLALGLALGAGCGGDTKPPVTDDGPPSGGDGSPTIDTPAGTSFSFFISSTGGPSGGDFRRTPADTDGLAGADEFCRMKAVAAVPASGSKTWRAYLSTATVNARDRIGAGPWFNRNGVMVASSLANLHDAAGNNLNKTTSIDENGATVPGKGDTPNQHDIITGSTAAGLSAATHCNNWTSSAATGVTAQTGHHDRDGGGADPTSWNSAHATSGCSAAAFVGTGGRGSIYCFAAN
ncbi:MAG TPA: hypothetical protein VNO30_27655 [Kofleriaceae bacterium]|nr:hypothetical protein [Kofleriaceae bacterium]